MLGLIAAAVDLFDVCISVANITPSLTTFVMNFRCIRWHFGRNLATVEQTECSESNYNETALKLGRRAVWVSLLKIEIIMCLLFASRFLRTNFLPVHNLFVSFCERVFFSLLFSPADFIEQTNASTSQFPHTARNLRA